jgi:uncharacterized damage-inducible protein DinB
MEDIAMQVSNYQSLFHQMEWADALIWRSVLNLPSLEFDKSMWERFHHFHSTQWAYGQLMQEMPLTIPDLSTFSNLKSIGLWARQFYKEVSAYFDELTEADLNLKVEFPWAAQITKRLGNVGPATVGDSIIQLALHTSYHRGQVALRLREAGGEPPLTDFIAWIWMERPKPDWIFIEAA